MSMRCFFDMDGVLCDFEGACLKLFDIPFPKERLSDEEFALFRDNLYLNIAKMGSAFWATLEPFPQMVGMFNRLDTTGFDVQILTAIPKHMSFGSPEALDVVEGKRAWVNHYFGDMGDKLHIVKADMKKYFVPNDCYGILIDDHLENCIDWRTRKGFPIHHKDYPTTQEEFAKISDDIYSWACGR